MLTIFNNGLAIAGKFYPGSNCAQSASITVNLRVPFHLCRTVGCSFVVADRICNSSAKEENLSLEKVSVLRITLLL